MKMTQQQLEIWEKNWKNEESYQNLQKLEFQANIHIWQTYNYSC